MTGCGPTRGQEVGPTDAPSHPTSDNKMEKDGTKGNKRKKNQLMKEPPINNPPK